MATEIKEFPWVSGQGEMMKWLKEKPEDPIICP